MKHLIFALLTLLCFSATAQKNILRVGDGNVKINGNMGEWDKVPEIVDDFGGERTSVKGLNATSFRMCYSENELYFKTKVIPSFQGVKEDVSILQILIDTDNSTDSGTTKDYKIYGVAPANGFDAMIELHVAKGGKVTAKVFKGSSLSESVNSYSGGKNVALSGSEVEVAIPWSDIGIVKAKKQTVRMLFAEYINKGGKAGYMKSNQVIGFKEVAKSAGSSSKGGSGDSSTASSDSDGESSGGGGKIWMGVIALIWLVSIVCAFAICPKAGLPAGMAAINILPVLGQIVFLFMLAFGEWPLHKDFHKLEKKVDDLERQLDEEGY